MWPTAALTPASASERLPPLGGIAFLPLIELAYRTLMPAFSRGAYAALSPALDLGHECALLEARIIAEVNWDNMLIPEE